jgi:hypothetical protein
MAGGLAGAAAASEAPTGRGRLLAIPDFELLTILQPGALPERCRGQQERRRPDRSRAHYSAHDRVSFSSHHLPFVYQHIHNAFLGPSRTLQTHRPVQGHCHCREQSASWGQGSWSRGACAAR